MPPTGCIGAGTGGTGGTVGVPSGLLVDIVTATLHPSLPLPQSTAGNSPVAATAFMAHNINPISIRFAAAATLNFEAVQHQPLRCLTPIAGVLLLRISLQQQHHQTAVAVAA
ncbi:hypothetical protein F0562_010449 [Nyssa sinensis]|uniref:Uncharacterized protein n=1 Tax=Nyssa sinensis TaxID=561372 RepID=A0A5J5A0X7_9ASTE|nr:hypothetical protein F0562_010449 [Nyssa sinensis]